MANFRFRFLIHFIIIIIIFSFYRGVMITTKYDNNYCPSRRHTKQTTLHPIDVILLLLLLVCGVDVGEEASAFFASAARALPRSAPFLIKLQPAAIALCTGPPLSVVIQIKLLELQLLSLLSSDHMMKGGDIKKETEVESEERHKQTRRTSLTHLRRQRQQQQRQTAKSSASATLPPATPHTIKRPFAGHEINMQWSHLGTFL